MPFYTDASITTVDGNFTVSDDPIDVTDGSEWPAGNFTIKIWDQSDVKVLKAVIYVGTRTTNALSDLTWNYGGHTDVNIADGDYAALEIASPNFPPPFWQAATIGAYDDYFQTDRSADWTAVAVSGTVDWAYNYLPRLGTLNRGAHASFVAQTAGDFDAYLKPISGWATGDYVQAAVRVARMYGAGVSGQVGVVLTDGTTSAANIVAIVVASNNNATNQISWYNGTLTSFGAAGISQLTNDALALGPFHLRLTQSNTNTFTPSVSIDGEHFDALGSDISKTITPTHAGFVVHASESTERSHALGLYFHSNTTP